MSSEPEADPDGLLVFVRALHREAGTDFAAALATLSTLLTNVLESPEDPKFRSVRLGNATFHRRLGRFAAALPLLRKFGFEDGQQQDAQAVTHLVLPVADAAHLARCLVLLEAAKQAAEMVAADEAGAPATVSAGAARRRRRRRRRKQQRRQRGGAGAFVDGARQAEALGGHRRRCWQ